MWEAAALGPPHQRWMRSLPADVHVAICVFRAGPRGRRVAVALRGERRARRAAAHRLLPDLVRDGDDLQGAACDRLRGFMPGDAGPETLWGCLARFEEAWIGQSGALLSAALGEGGLTVRAVVDDHEPGRLAPAGRAAAASSGLFAADRVAVTLRAPDAPEGDAEPAWRLKPTEVEAARAALALGYYENPRRCTMEDIARVLGITKSAVYHRMHGLEQKAVRRLIHQHGPHAPEIPGLPPAAALHVERALIGTPAGGIPAWGPPPP